MCRRVFIMMFFGFWVVIGLTSCDKSAPDLVPERRPGSQGSEGFCNRDDKGNLVIRVRNQGDEDASVESTTIVRFSGGSEKTPPMPAGSVSEALFEIPSTCFRPDCSFSITVDANDDVKESQEGNNRANGICIG